MYISDTVGTYVCNHVIYYLLEVLSKEYSNKIAGFIHVPYALWQEICIVLVLMIPHKH
ncbi:MAG: hypothetical protein AB8V24_03765 [Francisella endosymbiont of Hyalomma scupense]